MLTIKWMVAYTTSVPGSYNIVTADERFIIVVPSISMDLARHITDLHNESIKEI
jgi:hypothetical protein